MKHRHTTYISIQHIQYGLSVSIVLAIVGYAYFLCSSLAFAVSQKELAHAASIVQTEVAQLESEYLQKSQGFTEVSATTLGLVKISQKTFIDQSQSIGRIDTQTMAN